MLLLLLIVITMATSMPMTLGLEDRVIGKRQASSAFHIKAMIDTSGVLSSRGGYSGRIVVDTTGGEETLGEILGGFILPIDAYIDHGELTVDPIKDEVNVALELGRIFIDGTEIVDLANMVRAKGVFVPNPGAFFCNSVDITGKLSGQIAVQPLLDSCIAT